MDKLKTWKGFNKVGKLRLYSAFFWVMKQCRLLRGCDVSEKHTAATFTDIKRTFGFLRPFPLSRISLTTLTLLTPYRLLLKCSQLFVTLAHSNREYFFIYCLRVRCTGPTVHPLYYRCSEKHCWNED